MKTILILSLVLISLFAQEEAYAYKEKKDHFVYFVKLPEDSKQLQSATGKKEQTYYKNGVISEAARYITDDQIQVAFTNSPDLAAFEKRFSLKHIATLRKNVHIFENLSTLDDVELCSQLWEEKNIEYARPLFKSKKRLQ